MLGAQKNNKNYYEILEVSPSASFEEIKEGHTRAKNAYSEDSLALYSIMTPDERNRMLSLIDEAFNVISNSEKREAYDRNQGIKPSGDTFNLGTNTIRPVVAQEVQPASPKKPNLSDKNITKLVASNKYQLNYDRNDDFENEIIQAKEFSGEFLSQIRDYKKVSIERMSEMTRISKGNLRGIEEENLTHLPATVYVRGFVYQYAKCLKLNPELVASSYIHRLKMLQEKDQ